MASSPFTAAPPARGEVGAAAPPTPALRCASIGGSFSCYGGKKGNRGPEVHAQCKLVASSRLSSWSDGILNGLLVSFPRLYRRPEIMGPGCDPSALPPPRMAPQSCMGTGFTHRTVPFIGSKAWDPSCVWESKFEPDPPPAVKEICLQKPP